MPSSHKAIFVSRAKLRVQEKTKTTDNAIVYRWFLMHYCAVSSHLKKTLPYRNSARMTKKFFSKNKSPYDNSFTIKSTESSELSSGVFQSTTTSVSALF